jgi:hypothetical protein
VVESRDSGQDNIAGRKPLPVAIDQGRYIQVMSRRIPILLLTLTFLLAAGPADVVRAQSTSTTIRTPTGNIICEFRSDNSDTDSDSVVCGVQESSWKSNPKKPADCDLDWSPNEVGLSSDTNGTTITNLTWVGGCYGGVDMPICPKSSSCTVLFYGKSAQHGRIRCTSEKTGVTCVTTAGKKRGFSVSKSGYKRF